MKKERMHEKKELSMGQVVEAFAKATARIVAEQVESVGVGLGIIMLMADVSDKAVAELFGADEEEGEDE